MDSIRFQESTALISNYEDYVSSGLVQVRLYHSDAGNINHDMFVDYLTLDKLGVSELIGLIIVFFVIGLAISVSLILDFKKR